MRTSQERGDVMMEAQDVLTQYLGKVRGGRLRVADEEKALARRARGGDMRARQKLIESNLRLVFSIAKKYRGRGVLYRLRRAENALSIELGRDATEEELVERLGVKPEEARRLREVSQPISSINAKFNADETLTLREVWEELGISQERARQVEIKALRTIRTGRYASTLRRALSEAV